MQFVKASGAAANADEISLDDNDDDTEEQGKKEPAPPENEVEQQAVPDAVFGQLGARARFAQQKAS